MRPYSEQLHAEQLNEELERLAASGWQGQPSRQLDPEVERLVVRGLRLRRAPELAPDPEFARQLEQRLLRRQAARRQKERRAARRGWFAVLAWRAHPLLSAGAALCLVLLLSAGVLAAASGVENPENPLYALKIWEQNVQVSLAGTSMSQAGLHLQFARDRLNALQGLATETSAGAYQQALREFDQQVSQASQLIAGLPAGADRDQLTAELATLKSDAIQTLQGLLPRLGLANQLATTAELGQLGATVPQLVSVEVTLPAHPNGQATIAITGSDLQAGAQLLVDGKPLAASGSLQKGSYVFVVAKWTGNQHPHSIGIVNPDGTAAQTTSVLVKTAPAGGPGNGGNGSGHSGSDAGTSAGDSKP